MAGAEWNIVLKKQILSKTFTAVLLLQGLR
jgi:hypothetical protein